MFGPYDWRRLNKSPGNVLKRREIHRENENEKWKRIESTHSQSKMHPHLDHRTTPDTGDTAYRPGMQKGSLLPFCTITSAHAPDSWIAAAPSKFPRATSTLPAGALRTRLGAAFNANLVTNRGNPEVLRPVWRGAVKERGGGRPIRAAAEVPNESCLGVPKLHWGLSQPELARVVKRGARLLDVFHPPLDRRSQNRHLDVACSLLIRQNTSQRRL